MSKIQLWTPFNQVLISAHSSQVGPGLMDSFTPYLGEKENSHGIRLVCQLLREEGRLIKFQTRIETLRDENIFMTNYAYGQV